MNEIVVTGPDGVTVRFPAGTDAATIDRVMREAATPRPDFTAPDVGQPPGFGDVHEQRPLPGQSEQNLATKDFFPSLGTGLAQGAYELATLPATLLQGAGWLGNKFDEILHGAPRTGSEDYGAMGPVFDLQQQGRDWLAETLHEPTTTLGEFARTAGEFIPGAGALGPGRLLGNTVRYGVVPGVLSEAAGQATEGTDLELPARIAAAILGGAGMGVLANAGAGAGLPGNLGASAAVIARSLRGSNMTAAEAASAQLLINQARMQGITLTWPEALHRVTNGRIDMTALQRVIEQSRGGQPVMAPVMADRPAAAAAAAGRTTAAIGPTASPTALGQLAQELADQHIGDVRDYINQVTRPLYAAAGPVTVDPIAFGVLFNDPLVQAAIPAIRNSPVYSRFVAGQSDDSVAMMDALKKYFDDLAAKSAGERTQTVTSVYSQQASGARQAAVDASPDYAQALGEQSMLRRDWLGPLEAGPLGGVAATDDLAGQMDALFPRNPFSGSEREVGDAIGAIASQSPDAASALVRQHVEQVFNQATRNLTRGQNQFGPARFVAEIRGNPQQARNLEAAVRALPQGDARWEGLESLLRVLEATGARQPMGSGTSFNSAALAEMSRGTPLANLMTTIASPTEAAGVIRRWYSDFRLGRNGAQLAEIITDPASGPLLQRLATGGSLRDLQSIAATLLNQVSTTYAGQNFNAPPPSAADFLADAPRL